MRTVAIILAVLIIIGLLRIAVCAEYSSDGVVIKAKFGPFTVFKIPSVKKYKRPDEKKEAQKAAKKKAKKEEKERKKQEKKEKGDTSKFADKFGGSFQMIKKLLPLLFHTLNSFFRKKLVINELTLHYTVASADPYDTATKFGEFTAGLYFIEKLFKKFFRVKKCNMQTSFDFTVTEPVIYIKAKLSIALWQIFALVFGAGAEFIKILAENNYGKAA